MSARAEGSPVKVSEAVSTPGAPKALGPYSQAKHVRAGELEWLYTAGQVGLDPGSSELVSGDVAAQARQVLANLRAVLAAAGFTFADVVKTTIFLVDMKDFQDVNRVYAEAVGEPYPARSTVAVAGLPKDARVEIDLVCVRRVGS